MSSKTAVITKLALRNLRRQARRSLLTAASMIAGGALLIFSLILGDGTHEQWIDSAVRMADGHLTIQSVRFQGSRALKDRMSSESRVLVEQTLRQGGLPGEIHAMAPRLAVTGMASSSMTGSTSASSSARSARPRPSCSAWRMSEAMVWPMISR